MYNTLEACRQAWEKAGNHGGTAERIDRNTKWMQYYRDIAEQQESTEASFNAHAEEVISHLLDTGWLKKGMTALDIGSGMGTYALSLAKHCAKVTALDMDAASLGVLKNHASQLGLTNINGAQCMWEVYEPGSRYALTFSAMCPAICTYEELLKMESMTTETCCLIAVTRGSYDMHRKNLMALMAVKPTGGMTTEALWYYDMLYLMGRQPDVKNWTLHYKYAIPVSEACRRNAVYFKIFGIPEEESRPVLQAYFDSRAADGLVHDESHLNTALICWHPH